MLTPKAGALVDYFTPEEREAIFNAIFDYRARCAYLIVKDGFDSKEDELLKTRELDILSELILPIEAAKNYGK